MRKVRIKPVLVETKKKSTSVFHNFSVHPIYEYAPSKNLQDEEDYYFEVEDY